MYLPASHAFGDKLPTVDVLNWLAGDFWANFYGAQSELSAINGGLQQEFRQSLRRLHEITNAGHWHTTSAFEHETFWPLLIDPASVVQAPIVYGEGWAYDSNPPVFYGQVIEDRWRFPVDLKLAEFTAVCDSVVSPKTLIIDGFGASLHRTAIDANIELDVDPRITFRRVNNDAGKECLLIWLYMAGFDNRTIAKRYGQIFDTFSESTVAYQRAVNTVMDTYVHGSSELRLRKLLAAVVDEVVADADEVVELILTDRESPVVITNRRSVEGRPGKVPSVAVGDELELGDFFFETVRFTDFRYGKPDWMNELVVPGRIPGIADDTTIPSGVWPLIATRVGDYTRIESSFGTKEFWDWLNGDSGQFAAYLSQYLQLPVASHCNADPRMFPASFDVLQAIANSPLRYSLSVSQIVSQFLTPDAVSLLRLIREVVPPWVTHIVQFDGEPPTGWTTPNECSSGMQLLSGT